MKSYLTIYEDPNITAELAYSDLSTDKVIVGWYSNREVLRSVVHSHPYYEYLYMLSGKASYHVAGSRYELHPGEFLLIPPNVIHTGYYDTYDRLILQIDPTFWNESLITNKLIPEQVIPNNLMILDETSTYKWGIRSFIERIAVTSSISDVEERATMYHALLLELAIMIRQIIRDKGVGCPTATSPLVAFATTYIQEHYKDPSLTVSQLAQHAYVSREHLSRVFREYTMQNVHSYLTSLRMQSCRQDIADGKSILSACMENGFPNYSSFLKTFRKLYGITPQEYRMQFRNFHSKKQNSPYN